MDKSALKTVPPWLRHFLVHVVKRCCGVVVSWIEDVQQACEGER